MRKTGRCPEGEMIKGTYIPLTRIGAGIVLEGKQVNNSRNLHA